jgi:hypothetical protein
MTARCDLADISESRDLNAIADPALRAEAIDSTEANEPIEPMESTEPTEPIDSIEPFDAIDKNESSDHSDSREFRDDIALACRKRPSGSGAFRIAASFRAGPRSSSCNRGTPTSLANRSITSDPPAPT